MERINVQRKVLDQSVSFSYLPQAEHGLFLSGGLDSLSLLNWFSVDAPDLLKKITLFTIRKESFESSKKIARHFGLTKHIFIDSNEKQGEAARGARLGHPEISLFYAAITRNPDTQLNFKGPEAKRGERPTEQVELPFVDLDKRYTVQLAFDLKAPIELSHTCTSLDTLHCGRCFMCSERRWAFQALNLPDPASYTEI